jgi:hypothetical protein
MKKTIDKINYRIIYEGEPKELKSILECLVENFGNAFVGYIKKFSYDKKAISNSRERVYYNDKEIIYVPNVSHKKLIFPFMINESKEADKNFLEKNPSCRIET